MASRALSISPSQRPCPISPRRCGAPPRDLGGERLELRAHAPAVLAEEGDLLLEGLHLAVGRIERALQRRELVGLLVVAAPQLLERALAVAQLRGLRLELDLHLLHFVRAAVARLLGLAKRVKASRLWLSVSWDCRSW